MGWGKRWLTTKGYFPASHRALLPGDCCRVRPFRLQESSDPALLVQLQFWRIRLDEDAGPTVTVVQTVTFTGTLPSRAAPWFPPANCPPLEAAPCALEVGTLLLYNQ